MFRRTRVARLCDQCGEIIPAGDTYRRLISPPRQPGEQWEPHRARCEPCESENLECQATPPPR